MNHRSSVFALAGLAGLAAAPQPAGAAPRFKHIILIIQENRTPDNLFGSNPHFEPNVDIATHGVTGTGATIALQKLPLADCYDLGHGHDSFQASINRGFEFNTIKLAKNCAMPANAEFKYVDNSTGTVQPYFDIAKQNGFANRMFQTNQGPSFPAHQFLFGGTSAPQRFSPLFAAENTKTPTDAGCAATSGTTVAVIDALGSETANARIAPCFEHATLSDILQTAQPPISWRYYAPSAGYIWTAPNAIQHICVPATVNGIRQCTGVDWVDHVEPNNPAQVLSDISACNLRQMSWVIPTAEASDHPIGNTGLGPSWVASIVNAVGKQTCAGEDYWKTTAIFITWDDWGGWYDHVPPFEIVKPYNWGAGYTYGFRVPLLVVSAFTQPGLVSNGIFDFGSILLFIERNFGVGYIGAKYGTNKYMQYADFQAAQPGRGDLATFFNLASPKAFTPIAAPVGAAAFIAAPKSIVPVDDE